MRNFENKEEVLDFLKENKIVRFVRIVFPDVLGREMSFCIPSEEMKSAFENRWADFQKVNPKQRNWMAKI